MQESHFHSSYFNAPNPLLPPSPKKLRADHTSTNSFPGMSVDAPVNLSTGNHLDYSLPDFTSDLVSNAAVSHTQPSPPPMTGVPTGSFPDTFFDGDSHVPNQMVELSPSTAAQRMSHTYQTMQAGKPACFHRHVSHPPSSPLSSGSGNRGHVPGSNPVFKQDAVGHLGIPGQSSQMREAPVLSQHTYENAQMQLSIDPNLQTSPVESLPLVCSKSPSSTLPSDSTITPSKVEGRGVMENKMSDEAHQKRQADRAARNRESSRRAREKAKNRFRNMEMENFNLRDMVRNLRLQNEYLQAQYERATAIQHSCHSCRYKFANGPSSPTMPVSITAATAGSQTHTPTGNHASLHP